MSTAIDTLPQLLRDIAFLKAKSMNSMITRMMNYVMNCYAMIDLSRTRLVMTAATAKTTKRHEKTHTEK